MTTGYREEFQLSTRGELDPWHLLDDSTLLSVVLSTFGNELALTSQKALVSKRVELVKEVEPVLGSSGVGAHIKYYYKGEVDRSQPPPLSFLVTVKGGTVKVEASASMDVSEETFKSLVQNVKVQVELAIRDSCSALYSLFHTYDATACIRSLDCFIKLVFISNLLEEKVVNSRELLTIISSMHKRVILNENPRIISAVSDKGDVVRALVIPRLTFYFFGIIDGKETEDINNLYKLDVNFRLKVYVVSKVGEVISRALKTGVSQSNK